MLCPTTCGWTKSIDKIIHIGWHRVDFPAHFLFSSLYHQIHEHIFLRISENLWSYFFSLLLLLSFVLFLVGGFFIGLSLTQSFGFTGKVLFYGSNFSWSWALTSIFDVNSHKTCLNLCLTNMIASTPNLHMFNCIHIAIFVCLGNGFEWLAVWGWCYNQGWSVFWISFFVAFYVDLKE